MLFFKKKEKEPEEASNDKTQHAKNDIINSAVFGELEYDNLWRGTTEIGLFGEIRTIKLYIYIDYDEPIGSIQESAYRQFLSKRIEIEKSVETELYNAYNLDKSFCLKDRFVPDKFHIHPDGRCGISFMDKNADEGFSDQYIVVSIIPDVSYFGSEDDYI